MSEKAMTRKPVDLPFNSTLAVCMLAAGSSIGGAACAESGIAEAGAWHYSATVYGYLPSISGKTAFPVDAAGTPINVNVDTILDTLKFGFLGAFDAHNGKWGLFTDLIYLDVGASKTRSRDFTIGGIGVPASTSANLDLDMKNWVWTLAGEYRVASDPTLTVDLLAGARMIDAKQRLRWSIEGDLGSIPAASRSGSSEVNTTVWDGIVGVRGRYAFGEGRAWSVPFYVDVGTGQSTRTWQASTGISFAFKWGEVDALWRYLDYDMKSSKAIQDIRFSGPVIGATFRW